TRGSRARGDPDRHRQDAHPKRAPETADGRRPRGRGPMSAMECSELRDAAAELALGTLPGDQRAAAIAHLAHCGECQLRVEELSDAADSLLLACPEADPPRGFARRVVAGLEPVPRRRWRSVAAVVATGVLAGAL